jgi:hypothetical protein
MLLAVHMRNDYVFTYQTHNTPTVFIYFGSILNYATFRFVFGIIIKTINIFKLGITNVKLFSWSGIIMNYSSLSNYDKNLFI